MKNLVVILILSISQLATTQEDKLKIGSFSATNGIHGSTSSEYDGGLYFGLDLATEYKKNIFSLNFGLGGEVSIFGADNWYHELNLTYGREVFIKRWLALEGHIGLGYLNHVGSAYEDGEFVRRTKRVLGLPIRLKAIFYTGKRFGLGINANVNLNSHAMMFSGGILCQFQIN